MNNGFVSGVNLFLEGFRLIKEPKLRMFVILPLIINLLIFIACFSVAGMFYSQMVDVVTSWLPTWLHFLSSFLWLIYGALSVIIFAYGFVFIANLVGSPFYGHLSELVQKKVTGVPLDNETNWTELLASFPKSTMRELSKASYYLPRAFGLFILSLIPVVNLLAVPLWFYFSSWMMSLQYVDYPSDNNGQSFRELRKTMKKSRLTAVGYGMPIYLCSMVPILNLIVVPAAVCSATVYWLKLNEIDVHA